MNILPKNRKNRRIPFTEKEHDTLTKAMRFYINHNQTMVNDITSVIGVGNITLNMEREITHAKNLLLKLEARHG